MTGAGEKQYRVAGKKVSLSKPGKLLFPGESVTKADLADYYLSVAELALPLWRDRPVTLQRFPDGIEEEGYYQKKLPEHTPDWVARVSLKAEKGKVTYLLVQDKATLVYLVGQGAVTPHLGLSRRDCIDHPDRMIFDLDPCDEDFRKVQKVARALKELLARLKVKSFVQTTGSRGLHLFLPLDRSANFDQARRLARTIAERVVRDIPELATLEHRKSKRGDKVFIDYLRNAYGQTSAAPYAVRAKPGAPIATPLDWREALSREMTPQRYRIDNIARRLAHKKDPWAGMRRHAVSVRAIEKRLTRLG